MASVEQRIITKFCVRMGKSATETFEIFEACIRKLNVIKNASFWVALSLQRRQGSAEDDERCGRPVTSHTNENIKNESAVICANRQQRICEIAQSMGYQRLYVSEYWLRVLTCTGYVNTSFSTFLPQDKKAVRMEMVIDLISAVEKDPSLLCRIVIGGEKWCFLYYPQSKRILAMWKSPQSPLKQKFCQNRSKGKVILEVIFFNIQGIMHLEFIPEECTVNKEL